MEFIVETECEEQALMAPYSLGMSEAPKDEMTRTGLPPEAGAAC